MHVFCMGDDVWFFSRWIKALHAMTYDKWSKMLIVRYPDRIILPPLLAGMPPLLYASS